MKTKTKARKLQFGDRPIVSIGLSTSFWRDVYHHSMTATWPVFLGALALAFLLLNVLFAGLFALGDDPVANMASKSFVYYFFFSVETLGTVGYGDMHPQTLYGHSVACVETFIGLIFAAVITGMIFSRFSRPKARILFSKVLTVSTHDGQRMLSVRLANERHNAISNATAKLWVLRNEQTREGRRMRRFHPLAILRSESPIFVLSWSLFHVIDEASPLHGLGPGEIERADASFVVSVQGHDENFAQEVHARQTYTWRDLRWGVIFLDLFMPTDDGSTVLDYRRFHEVQHEDLDKKNSDQKNSDQKNLGAAEPVRAAS